MNGKRYSIFSREAKLPPDELLRREAETEAALLERDILERGAAAIRTEYDLKIQLLTIECQTAQRKYLLDWLSREIPAGMSADKIDNILRGSHIPGY